MTYPPLPYPRAHFTSHRRPVVFKAFDEDYLAGCYSLHYPYDTRATCYKDAELTLQGGASDTVAAQLTLGYVEPTYWCGPVKEDGVHTADMLAVQILHALNDGHHLSEDLIEALQGALIEELL